MAPCGDRTAFLVDALVYWWMTIQCILKLKMHGSVSSHPVLIDAKAAHPGIPWHCSQRRLKESIGCIRWCGNTLQPAAVRLRSFGICAVVLAVLQQSVRDVSHPLQRLIATLLTACRSLSPMHQDDSETWSAADLLDHLDMSQQAGCLMLPRCPSTFHRVSCSPRCNSAWMKHWLPPCRTKDTRGNQSRDKACQRDPEGIWIVGTLQKFPGKGVALKHL